MIVCTYEDRLRELPGLQLLLLSLAKVSADVRTRAFVPRRFWPRVSPHLQGHLSEPGVEQTGWTVKPWLLLKLLNEGFREVVWIDADIILTADFRPLLDGVSDRDIVVAEEPWWVQKIDRSDRVTSWGLKPGRRLGSLVNSCFVRVTRHHTSLLEHWAELLNTPEYRNAQARPFAERPPHTAGDQDVLHALLGSDLYLDSPVRFLRSGIDIAQCHLADGYRTKHRLRRPVQQLPPLVHAQGFKPWRKLPARPAFVDVSPYVLVALRYRHSLHGDNSWMASMSWTGRILRVLTRDDPNLAGLLPALMMEVRRYLRVRSRLARVVSLSKHRIPARPSSTP